LAEFLAVLDPSVGSEFMGDVAVHGMKTGIGELA
jgi:hypothetical protein